MWLACGNALCKKYINFEKKKFKVRWIWDQSTLFEKKFKVRCEGSSIFLLSKSQIHKFTNSGIWFFITRYFDDLWTLMNIISFFEKKVVTTKDTGQLPVHHSMGYRTKGSNPLYILPEHIFSRMELSFPGRWDWTSASDSGFNGITTLFTEFISNISIWMCSLTTFATLCGRICVTFVK